MADRAAPAPPRSPRRLGLRTAALAGALALLCAGLWLARRPLAGALLRAGLERAGFADVALTVTEIGLDGIELREVSSRGARLELAALGARWSLAGRRIEELRARGLRMRAELRGSGAGGPASAPRLLAVLALLPRSVSVEDARLELETDLGPLALAVAANVREAEGELRGEAELEVSREAARMKLELALHGAPGSLDGSIALEGVSEGSAELPAALALKGQARIAWRDPVLEIYTPGCVDLHISRAELGRARLEAPLDACAGKLERPALRVDLADRGRPSYRGELPLRAPEARIALGAGATPVSVLLREPSVSVALDAASAPGLALDVSAESAESAALSLRVEAPLVRAKLANGALDAALSARALRDLRTPASVVPLALSGSLARAQAQAPIALRFELASAGRRLLIDGQGSLEPEAGRASAQLALRPLEIGPDARLAELSPALRRWLGPATGRVEARASVSVGAQGPRVEIDLALRDGALETRAARLSGVNGRILLQGPDPWSTPPGQLVSVALTRIGLPLSDGLLSLQLRPGGALNLESAAWRMFGGDVQIRGPFDFGADRRTLTLEARGLDLAEITRAAELEGLAGTGRIDGKVPLRFAGDEAFFDKAELHSTGAGGTIQYRPEPGGRSLGSRPEIQLALRALESFRYDELRITLDGDIGKSVVTGLYIRGSNPTLERSRPVEFNVKVDAPLGALLNSSLTAYRLPEAIEDRLRDFDRRGATIRRGSGED